MVTGYLSVRDLPGAWNDGMISLLGIVPPDDRRGCLQDIHWYTGLFGYFPCYTLGAMAAAQMMAAVRRAIPDLDAAFGRGDLSPLLGWLRANVHARGSLHGFKDLLLEATGSVLNPSFFEAHLTARYLG
jgi:carboxypeptidase Taq